MKSIEVNTFNAFICFYFSLRLQPNVANGGVNKPPPYPVERSTMISEPPAPDPHTADLVSYVIKISQNQSIIYFF
jgi:hypothetical protein